MSSSVYFKFKSQKEPTRVAIDGPHTDVWNLKREIITLSRLGDGTDFDLKIYKENSDEEYTDDTEIIPKDSTVIARRVPAAVPGKGRAARYVSGKPPASAKPTAAAARSQVAAAMDSALTEEERLKAMLKMTDAQWQQKQEEMSHDQRIHLSGQKPGRKANVPEGEPPHGYVCYRCGDKGHWIQACPTNDDASYDNRTRIKKTTGIPRSMLQKVERSEIENLDEQQRSNVMLTSEGEYVVAQADKKTWQKFQDQKNATDQAQKNVESGDKQLQELGLECPIDKRMFVDPMKTPCCGKTYCHECIENALLDNDLECPGCHTANVSLERLEPDEDIKNKIKDHAQKKDGGSPTMPNAASPKSVQASNDSRPGSRDGVTSPKSPGSIVGKKRSASDITETNVNLSVPAPAMKRQKSGGSDAGSTKSATDNSVSTSTVDPNNPTMEQMQAMMKQMENMPQNMNGMNAGMGFPGMMPYNMPNPIMPVMPSMPAMNPMMMMNMMMNGMGGMPPVNMNGGNGMANGMNGGFPNNNTFNSNFNNNHNANGQGWNNNNNNNYHHQNQNQYGPNRGNGYRNKKFHTQHNHPHPQQHNAFQQQQKPASSMQQQQQNTPAIDLSNVPKGPKSMKTGGGGGPPVVPGAPTGPKFSNQQRHVGNEEDNAYMRQPVNPHRAMNRMNGRKGMRNADYKEL
ncbi:Protein mpe1 [Lithohypha guttulata]|uniref:Protein mpe1 n=1 Tax=Lithohypha guttulata TaxID=1690604 RepID=A0AAN7PHY3_9EURO|nr:Protein mpe1 [Lithohypha guttulata]KAK5102795.1 Protein mpe1 [Lithohypha guttulata]